MGFSDETLKKYGWVDAKESGVGLLAFFATLSPEQRKVLEAENRKKRRSLNPITGETELVQIKTANGRELVEWKDVKTGETCVVSRNTANGRELVEWKDVKTGETCVVSRSTANGRELVERKDLETGETYMVSRSTAYQRELVERKDLETGETYMVSRSTAYRRELVEWKDLTLTRSALRSIIDSEKKGNWCPCGDNALRAISKLRSFG